MNKRLEKILSEKEMPLNFIRFYAVGLLIFIIPFTRDIFIYITWLTLILVIAAIFYYHRNWNAKTVLWMLFIFISAFFFEMIGTQTGAVFGEYRYGPALGPKINDTPLIIGLNWVFLVYSSREIARRFSSNSLVIIISGALLMIVYDIVVELVAPVMHMWSFNTPYPPFQNFLSWFLASIVYHSGFEFLKIRYKNRPAAMLFIIQIVFFLLIWLYSLLFIS